jgi:hypothetical protein
MPVELSSPTTRYGPAVVLGTLNVQTKPPIASVVIVAPVTAQFDPPVGVCRTELNVTDAGDDTLKPVPVTV